MNNGKKLNLYCQNPANPNAAADHGLTTAEYLKAFFGYCVQVRLGRICQNNFQAPQLAGDGLGIGKNKTFGLRRGVLFFPNSTNKDN
jgi:hypothetical protein